MWVEGGINRWVGPTACKKWSSWTTTWDWTGRKFALARKGPHPKYGFLHLGAHTLSAYIVSYCIILYMFFSSAG
jgi:CHASE2 domain-containing sensor protein